MTTEARLELLKPLVTLGKDEFMCLRVLKRRKDNPDLEYSVKQLKTYSFYSWSELEEQLPRIKEICDLNNARAYIRLNKQNSVDVSLRCISEMTDNIRNGNAYKNKGVWDSVCGKGGAKSYWVIDIDKQHLDYVMPHPTMKGLKILHSLKADLALNYWHRVSDADKKDLEFTLDSEQYSFPIIENPTKSGVHLIVRPFDTRILERYNKELSSKGISVIDLQKDANSILYIGNQK